MTGRCRCRNVGARLRRLSLETGFTLLATGLAPFMAGLLLWLLGVDSLAYYGFIVRKALLAGALGGMLWGLLPAILKIWRNINEIITSLMMSFLGVSLANVLVKLLLADPATTVPQTRNLPWEQRLLMLLGGRVSSGLLLGLLAVLLTHGLINHSTLGLRIRVVGANPHAARHAGLPDGALTLAIFALSAGLAGLAGAVEIMAIQGNVRADWNPSYSLVVVPLVFLAQFNGFGSLALVFVFSVLSIGSESAARRVGIPNHFTLLTVALLLIVPGLTRLAVTRLRQALRQRTLRNTTTDA